MSRADPLYLEVARMAARLGRDGFLVATGGGPGAMEAANLGARPLAAFLLVMLPAVRPGLVAGASKGEGLGNQFLSHIRETDAIVNVVRCFEDENVIHVAGKVDPIADIEVIQTELCLADLSAVEKALHRVTKTARSGDKESIKLVAILEKCQAALNEAKPVRTLDFSKEELPLLKQFFLITAKPAMFVANVAEDGFAKNPLLDRLQAFAAAQNAPVVAICAKLEAEMSEMSDEDRDMFLSELGQTDGGRSVGGLVRDIWIPVRGHAGNAPIGEEAGRAPEAAGDSAPCS